MTEDSVAEPVPQVLVVVVSQGVEDVLEGFRELEESGRLRATPRWDTWRGLYLVPPEDSEPWTWEEYRECVAVAEAHPDVMRVDRADGDGAQGVG